MKLNIPANMAPVNSDMKLKASLKVQVNSIKKAHSVKLRRWSWPLNC
jgi:hypothetical protein